MQIDFARKQLRINILYYGTAGAGVRTHRQVLSSVRTNLVVPIDEDEGGALVFEVENPSQVAQLQGFDIRLSVHTIAATEITSDRLAALLSGFDGLVFVADSRVQAMAANRGNLTTLRDILRQGNLTSEELPVVLVWNKQDDPEAVRPNQLDEELNPYGFDSFPTQALHGVGVATVLDHLTHRVLHKVERSLIKSSEAAGPERAGGTRRFSARRTTSVEKKPGSGVRKRKKRTTRAIPIEEAPPPAAAPVAASPAPAPAPAGAALSDLITDEEAAAEFEAPLDADAEVSRRTTVHYFEQMHPQRNFPLRVWLSRDAIAKPDIRGVAEAEGDEFAVAASRPVVQVIPHFPGCMILPGSLELDVTPDRVEALFWVTPLAVGKLDHARVEIWQDGRLLSRIPTPCRVVRQTLAKFMLAGGILSPVIGVGLELMGVELKGVLPWLVGALEPVATGVGGFVNLGLIAAGGIFALAAGVYAAARPRAASPVTQLVGLA